MRPRPTLHDVCALAQVSTFTASRALSGHAGVAAETRKRVGEAAASLGYVPNQHARSLKSSASRVVAVLTANMANHYYAALVAELESRLETAGYDCLTMDAVLAGTYSQERENRFVAALMAQRAAAVVVTYTLSQTNMQALAAWGVPLVFVDCTAPAGFPNYPSVSSDSYHGSLELGRHLAGLGHRRWAFVGHARGWNTRQPRQAGFEAAALAAGASVDIIEGENDSASAARAVEVYLATTPNERWPEVIYASNTVLLHGTLAALRRHGIAIPETMAVVAFDDFEWADMLDPPVTVVDQDIAAIGRAAGELVLDRVSGRLVLAIGEVIVLKTVLRIRGSCGAGRRGL